MITCNKSPSETSSSEFSALESFAKRCFSTNIVTNRNLHYLMAIANIRFTSNVDTVLYSLLKFAILSLKSCIFLSWFENAFAWSNGILAFKISIFVMDQTLDYFRFVSTSKRIVANRSWGICGWLLQPGNLVAKKAESTGIRSSVRSTSERGTSYDVNVHSLS